MALAIAGAGQATAQITTYIPPARHDTLAAKATAAADSVRRDSVARLSLTDMKAWVDSAAGVTLPVMPRTVDSTVVMPDPVPPVRTLPPVTTFEDGMPAPATASDLPALALFGVFALAAGVALLTYRPRH